ncbi:glutathione S-transferase family protein, partial [Klebsiella aerogenes]|uniref:hypothetical protein n=1 Tax=Klebsiella aerogenes TaxID=548 RepID=UPI0019536210
LPVSSIALAMGSVLEERYPQPSLYPVDIGQRAQARGLEEYADSRLGQVIIWQLFHQLVILE